MKPRVASLMKEIAKFLCGAEAFHALGRTYFWLSERTVVVLGITQTSKWHGMSAAVNAIIAIVLGIYAWRPRATV